MGVLTRSAFPTFRLEVWGENEIAMFGKEGGQVYTNMIALMTEDCPDMMASAVRQFHSELGDPPGTVTAENEAKHVERNCAKVLQEAFPLTSFRFLAGNMMHAAQRLWERKCVLGAVSGSRGSIPIPSSSQEEL